MLARAAIHVWLTWENVLACLAKNKLLQPSNQGTLALPTGVRRIHKHAYTLLDVTRKICTCPPGDRPGHVAGT